RMDPTAGPTAADVLNGYPEGDLRRVLREYGEERFAGRIAAAVVAQRARRPFETTAQLVEVVYQNVPAATRRHGGHPAKRTFQALRIEVNGELAALHSAVPAALHALAVGGRLVAMSYHSLEDRIVKRALAALSTSRTPAGLPVELPGHGPQLAALTRGAARAISGCRARLRPAGSAHRGSPRWFRQRRHRPHPVRDVGDGSAGRDAGSHAVVVHSGYR